LDAVGLGLEPDPHLGGKRFDAGTAVLLYRIAKPLDPPSPAYHALKIMVEVGLVIAAADGEVAESEWERLISHIDQHEAASDSDRERLRAYARYLVTSKQVAAKITKARFAKIPEAARKGLGALAVSIALVDGSVSEHEEEAITRLYKALGLPMEGLDSLSKVDESGSLAINWEAVATLQQETNQVQSLLADAMDDDADADADAPIPMTVVTLVAATTPLSSPDAKLSGLDPALLPILQELAGRSQIIAADFAAVCRANKTMPAAARDRLNEWAQEALGDDLLLDEDPITVQSELLPPLPESSAAT
jgi:tellurite resistance protein